MFDYKERSYLTDEDCAEIRAEALAEGKAEVAKALEQLGIDAAIIRKATGLSIEDEREP